jgi:energy-coupling factor transporter transmembrane protein EcfT
VNQETLRLPSSYPQRTQALEARAVLVVSALTALGVALAPAGWGLVIASIVAAGAGVLLSRSSGNTLGRSAAGQLLLFAAMAFVLNALFTPGTGLVFWGRELPLSREGIRVGGETALRILAMVLLFRGLVQSVAPLAVVSAVERSLAPLRRLGFRSEKLAVVLMIALQVAPSFATEARRLSLQRALRRGWPGPAAPLAVRRRRLRTRLRDLPAILVPLMGLALRRAEELAWALPARYFGEGERTPAVATPWADREWGVVAMAVVFLAVSLWARGSA